jgi:hypothetical protein
LRYSWGSARHLREAPGWHPDPGIAPFEFNGSLSKLGVREKLAAEELVEQWTVQFLSSGGGLPDPNTFESVEQAIHDYLAEKRGTLDPSKESTKLTIQKIGGILIDPGHDLPYGAILAPASIP